jgi:RNA polymerase-binding transcription factor DksA
MTAVPASRAHPGPSAGDAPSLGLLLEAERAATLARLRTLRIEFDGVVLDALDANLDDEHDPEGPTIAWERAQLASLIDDASSSLADLDEALQRLERGTSATCERCGGTIAAERLEARPGTRECIRCAWFGRTRSRLSDPAATVGLEPGKCFPQGSAGRTHGRSF